MELKDSDGRPDWEVASEVSLFIVFQKSSNNCKLEMRNVHLYFILASFVVVILKMEYIDWVSLTLALIQVQVILAIKSEQ